MTTETAPLKRRRLLLAATGATIVAVAGGVAVRRATLAPPSIGALVSDLQALKTRPVTSSTAWSPFKVFTHLAQSIEYSMTGYPVMNSALFQHTAGAAAFFVFGTAGAMRHGLAEPIPGAPAIADAGPANDALDHLVRALQSFEQHSGALRPHFAYGDLNHTQYTAAHVMHVRNHLQEIRG